jgi:hypothetical protein
MAPFQIPAGPFWPKGPVPATSNPDCRNRNAAAAGLFVRRLPPFPALHNDVGRYLIAMPSKVVLYRQRSYEPQWQMSSERGERPWG